MGDGKYRTVCLSKELVEAIIDFMENNPQANYSSVADFVSDAVRSKFQQLRVYPGNISLLDINANEMGPLLFDRNLRKTVQILITRKGLECAECKANNCRHIKFAMSNPKTQGLIQERKKEGWDLPNI